MYKETYIKDFYGRAIGILRDYDNGDQAVLSYPARLILGFYRKDRDVTTDFYGRILTRGNTVTSLIFN